MSLSRPQPIHDESGTTLVELMVGMMTAMFILSALTMAIVSTMHGAGRVSLEGGSDTTGSARRQQVDAGPPLRLRCAGNRAGERGKQREHAQVRPSDRIRGAAHADLQRRQPRRWQPHSAGLRSRRRIPELDPFESDRIPTHAPHRRQPHPSKRIDLQLLPLLRWNDLRNPAGHASECKRSGAHRRGTRFALTAAPERDTGGGRRCGGSIQDSATLRLTPAFLQRKMIRAGHAGETEQPTRRASR